MKSPSLRRIQADIRELRIDPSDRYAAAPLEDDMFEWHFTIRGADGTEFEGGVYHGRILLPPDYPFKPPNIVFLTPSGRFEVGTKVCLSFSAHHPELWQPAWGIRLILEALISFLPTPADGAIGALDWTKDERKRLAKKSIEFCCSKCGNCAQLLPELKKGEESKAAANRFQKEIEKLHALQMSHHEKKDDEEAKEEDKKVAADDKKNADEDEEGEGKPKAEDVASTVEEEEIAEPTLVQEEGKEEGRKVAAAASESTGAASAAAPAPASAQSDAREKVTTSAASATPTPAATPAAAVPATPAPRAAIQSNEPPLSPWFSDPVVHAAIILFAVLVAMLYRKFIALVEELQGMANEY